MSSKVYRPPSSLASLSAFALLLAAAYAVPACAADGFLISVRYESDKLGNIHDNAPGKLMRYDLKNDQVVGSKTLHDKDDVGMVCLSPFGDRIAFTKQSGEIAVIGVDGGSELVVGTYLGDDKPKPGENPRTGLQWPASDGGQWIYYTDARNNGMNNALRRVNVGTKQDELVVKFNRGAVGAFALSLDATPHSGKFIKRTDNYTIAIYDLASGDGDLFNCPRTGGCGESISPDGSLLCANNGSHTGVNLVDMAGQHQSSFRLSQWDGDPCKDKPREQVEWAWQSFRWSVNSLNWISVTQGKLKLGSTHEIYFGDAMLYDWVNQRQINVTRNKAGAFDRAGGFWEQGGQTASLGYFAGKAPLRVDLHDPRVTEAAKWDFGDGSPAVSGRNPQHTYEKPGAYRPKATQGELTFEAQVNVQKRIAPRGACHVVSERCLLVDFSEAVRGKDIAAKLASGAPVTRVELNDTGKRLLIELATPLTHADKLTLTGLTDNAQQPNALDSKPIDVLPPAWPANRQGIVFVWDTGKTLNAVYDETTRQVRELRVARDAGQVGIDRYGRMRLDDGRFGTGFFSQANAQEQFGDLVRADAFSLEVILQSTDLKQKKPNFPARIVNCSAWHDNDWEFMLGEQEDRLLASIRTTDNMLTQDGKPTKSDLHGRAPIYEIAKLPDMLPHHLILSYAPGRMVAYLDGKTVFESKEVTGSLKAWGYGELCFGGNHNGGRHGWLGRLEGVAIYKRFIEPAEAQRNAELARERLRSRHSVPQLEVEAKLVAASKIPTLADIAPYRDALVVNEFVITKIQRRAPDWNQSAGGKEGQTIRVAQWGLVDGLTTPLKNAKVGGSYPLTLESYVDHPDKLDEIETSSSLETDFDAPLLYQPQP